MSTCADVRKRNPRSWLRFPAAACILTFTALSVVALPAPVSAAGTEIVTSCADSGSGSLRAAVASAESGFIIAFDSSLSCSTITLTSGPITIATDLTITGPGANVLAVSGHNATGIFQIGTGDTVGISGLTIEDANNAAAIVNSGTLTITASTLSTNNSGAIVNGATTSVFDSTLSNNSSLGAGAGITNNGKLAIDTSTFAGNSADFGGGIYNGGTGFMSVVDSTFSGNVASGPSSTGSGGGIYNDSSPANVILFGTVMAQSSTGHDCAGGVTSHGDNLDDDGSCSFSSNTDLSHTSSGLDPSGLQNNGGPTQTIALEPGSAAIGADNSPQLCSSSDQRGVQRPLPCDIGAYQTATKTVTNCNDSGSGSLRQAVANAVSTVGIAFALDPPCTTIALLSPIDITANVTIDGPGADAMAVSGGGAVEDFVVASGVTSSISGLTIEDGRADEGGGVLNNGTLTITTSALSGNTATTSGGAVANAGTLTVTDTTMTDNAANDGGGGAIATLTGATTTVTDSVLADNSAVDQGGALFSVGAVNGSSPGTVVIENSTLSDNTATVYGGAIASGGTLWVIRSTLSGNSAANRGGGIESFGGAMLIGGSTLAGNAASAGGGFENDGSSTTTVVTSTLSGNTGGDITNIAGTLNLQATIVANAVSGTDCSGTISDHGENLVDDGSCELQALLDFPDSPAGLDPRGLENNDGPTETIALEPGSPAIGSVPSAEVCANPDQRGVARPTPCDIGAVDAVLTAQTITFSSTAPSSATVGGPPYVASAVASSGLPVSLSIDASAVSICSLAGSTVTFISAGTCVINANQAGGGIYDPASQVGQSFTVGPAPDSITSADGATAVVGTRFSFTITTTGALSITKKGDLPRHHRFVDNGDGTATLSGVPRKAGTYPLTIEARFAKGTTKKIVTQAFTLTVDPA